MRYFEKIKGNKHYQQLIFLGGVCLVLFGIFLIFNWKAILGVFVVGTGEDKYSFEILHELFLLIIKDWNPILMGLLLVCIIGLLFLFNRAYPSKLNLIGVMNGIVYFSAISIYVERAKPIFFTFPLFVLLIFRSIVYFKENTENFVGLIKKNIIIFVLFALLLLLHAVGILQVITGTADPIRLTIDLVEQSVAISPIIHALIFFSVITVNEWQVPEFEKFAKVVLFLGIFLFIEAVLAFYFRLDFLFDISYRKYLGRCAKIRSHF